MQNEHTAPRMLLLLLLLPMHVAIAQPTRVHVDMNSTDRNCSPAENMTDQPTAVTGNAAADPGGSLATASTLLAWLLLLALTGLLYGSGDDNHWRVSRAGGETSRTHPRGETWERNKEGFTRLLNRTEEQLHAMNFEDAHLTYTRLVRKLRRYRSMQGADDMLADHVAQRAQRLRQCFRLPELLRELHRKAADSDVKDHVTTVHTVYHRLDKESELATFVRTHYDHIRQVWGADSTPP